MSKKCKTFLQHLRRQVARLTWESSAIADERTDIVDGCTDADGGCAFIGDGGTFPHEVCRNVWKVR